MGEQCANTQMVVDIVGQTADEQIAWIAHIRTTHVYAQRADRPGSIATQDLGAGVHPNSLAAYQPDAARVVRQEGVVVDQTGAEGEDVGAFRKEPPLLGKEQRKARQIDLIGIGFRLGEVRIEGQCGGDAGRQVVTHVTADLACAAIADTVVTHQRVRGDFETVTLLKISAPRKGSRACQIEDRSVEADAGPLQAELVARHVALDVEPPDIGPLPDLQAAHVDRDFSCPAGRGAAHLGVPDTVPIVIRIARSRRHQAVRARAAGIDLEYIAQMTGIECVEHDRDVIVVFLITVALQ